MTFGFFVRLTPRAYRAGEHLLLPEQLANGSCPKCPGKWRVLSSAEGERLGMLRTFTFTLEPLDADARFTASHHQL